MAWVIILAWDPGVVSSSMVCKRLFFLWQNSEESRHSVLNATKMREEEEGLRAIFLGLKGFRPLVLGLLAYLIFG